MLDGFEARIVSLFVCLLFAAGEVWSQKNPKFSFGVLCFIRSATYASATLLNPVTTRDPSIDLMYSLTLSLLSLM